jgi:hypothetical protein
MLRKILLRNQSFLQLVIALFGAFLGIVFLLVSVHYFIKVTEFGEGSEMLGPNTLVIQKKVSTTTTLQLASTSFSAHEIHAIKNKSFIADVQPVMSNNFGVEFATSDPMLPYFRSDVFIQSIETRFLDVKSKFWKWDKNSDFVPIILPRDFMVMLNTFMSSSGIPQISDELAKDVLFSLQLSNDRTSQKFNAKIIGFTNEVSSILVPKSFMQFGKNTFGTKSQEKITQLMISGKEKEFGLLEKFLQKQHYESKNAQLVTGRLKSIVSTLLLVVACISFLTLLFSSFVLVQYIQLLISKNSYEIKTLLRLGYATNTLSNVFIYYFVLLFGSLCLVGILFFVLIKSFLDEKLESTGIYIDFNYSVYSWATLGVSFVLFYIVVFISSKRNILNEF